MQRSPLQQIYHLKLALFGVLALVVGVALSLVAAGFDELGEWHLLGTVLSSLSDLLVVTGGIGIAVDFFTGRAKEAADTERLRAVLRDAAPDIRNAVVAGFAETPDNMSGVATTETLDKLATNALALRLGDEKFAAEIYSGLLAQAIRTPERWSDVDINVRLSCIQERSSDGAARKTAAPLFDVVVTWEYTLIPSTRIQRFASTNSTDEFREFLDDVPATSTWFIDPQSGADAREPAAFEVLAYSVDGEELPVRRSARRNGQTYSVDLGEVRLLEKQPVRIRHVYRTVSRRAGHRFRIALTQPTHGMRMVLDYTDTDIAELKVGEMLSTAVPAQVKFLPSEAPAKQVEVSVPGWLLPKAEVSFVWTLSNEASGETTHAGSRAT